MSETVISPDSREEALHSGHHPDLQHHFDDMEQQKEASSLGMWVFLAQEIMFFGGLFLLYLIYRMNYYNVFSLASSSIDVKWGAINTVVLIGSSVTMAMAVHLLSPVVSPFVPAGLQVGGCRGVAASTGRKGRKPRRSSKTAVRASSTPAAPVARSVESR